MIENNKFLTHTFKLRIESINHKSIFSCTKLLSNSNPPLLIAPVFMDFIPKIRGYRDAIELVKCSSIHTDFV